MEDGTGLARFDNTMQSWSLVSTYNQGAWDHPNETLYPGEGALLYVVGGAAQVDITGNQAIPVLPGERE